MTVTNVKYTYKGRQVGNIFVALSADLDRVVQEAMRMVAQELGKDTEPNVPYLTGQLSRSLRIYSDGQAFIVEFGEQLPYTKKVYYVTAKNGKLKWTEYTYSINEKKYVKIFDKKLSEL